MVKKIKRSTAYMILGVILAIVLLGPSLGLFASGFSDPDSNFLYPDDCLDGDMKCCSYSNSYCKDGSGNIQMFCTSSSSGNSWASLGEKTDCQSNVLSKSYYRWEDGDCSNWIYMAVEDKTEKDFDSLSSCYAYRNAECIGSESKCEGEEYFECVSEVWVSAGQIEGHCGYQVTGDCTSGNSKCEGEVYYICTNEVWDNQGNVVGKCGYTESTGTDGTIDSTITSFELSKVLFSVGGFDITLLFLLIAIGGLILIKVFI